MKKQSKIIILLLLAVIIVSLVLLDIIPVSKWFGSNSNLTGGEQSNEEQDETDKYAGVDPEIATIIDGMEISEKIAQLFIVRIESLDDIITPSGVHDAFAHGDVACHEGIKRRLQNSAPGGIVFFNKNIEDPEQLLTFTTELKESASFPMFICVDEEGGTVSRIANDPDFNVTTFESMEAIGSTGDPSNAENIGRTIGAYLNDYGFNLNFAPVADINTNLENIIIGNRAFGSDPQRAAQMISAEIDGFHSENIMTCIKHFPGHGDTVSDTHEGFVSIDKTWDELLACEIIPFRESLDKTDMVMVAHITTPNVTTDGLPASLSYEMITGKLRNELGYDGVIITDSLAMGAITNEYTSGESAVMAIQAGVDILLMPYDYREASSAILRAYFDGNITEERIDESVIRILELKQKYRLI